ncbi:DNA-binding storekeeper protein-related transcriptional regulator [Parasponia andersonii]|uniref:DNA-binding storekeeper protein-related transcriptional regulator n=1 Tax=Parasponia andersonii TaxID=3476 RepID=A0A2P5BIA7_PARAD|nr:DNA-binding storekeeper protein-related transcriptional regulator [Parasponia andersonii]
MAPKRLIDAVPPSASSSEEESDSETVNDEEEEEENSVAEGPADGEKSGDESSEEEEEEEEEGDDADEEEEKKKPSEKKSQVESGTGSDSETESDDNSPPSPSTADFTIKPSKPMEDSSKPKSKKPTKPSTSTVLALAATPVSKRAAETELNGKDSKKKKSSSDEDQKKASGFQRLWSEGDEIVILKGMIEYQAKTGRDPYADMGAFLEFIKKNLHVDVDKRQLMNKIRRLKKKYQNNAEKGETGFSKPHESKTFQLSKDIWGAIEANNAADGNDDAAKSAKKGSKQGGKTQSNGLVKADPDEFWASYPCFRDSLRFVNNSLASEDELKKRLPLIGSSKVKELENRWKKLKMEELELHARKEALVFEQSKLFLNSI